MKGLYDPDAQQPLWPEVVAKGFVVQAKRWVVERTHAWNERARRLMAHHDRSTWAPVAWVCARRSAYSRNQTRDVNHFVYTLSGVLP